MRPYKCTYRRDGMQMPLRLPSLITLSFPLPCGFKKVKSNDIIRICSRRFWSLLQLTNGRKRKRNRWIVYMCGYHSARFDRAQMFFHPVERKCCEFIVPLCIQNYQQKLEFDVFNGMPKLNIV